MVAKGVIAYCNQFLLLPHCINKLFVSVKNACGKMLFVTFNLENNVEDSGAEVECWSIRPNVPGSNPMMSRFCLCDFSIQTARELVKSSGSRHRA